MRKVLLRLLLKLLDVPQREDNRKDKAEQFMARAAGIVGFEEYIQHRDRQIVSAMAGGDAMQEATRERYIRMIGQRFENINFAAKCRALAKNLKK